MAGEIIVGLAIVIIALLVLAWIRNPLVGLLNAAAGFLGAALALVLSVLMQILTRGRLATENLIAMLRSVHREGGEQRATYWDFIWGPAFLAILAILIYSDYTLFKARVGPILFNIASGVQEQTLNGLLGYYFIVTFLVIGIALSDAYGHLPGGSLMFALINDAKQRKFVQLVMWCLFVLAIVAALCLGVWTVEKTAMHQQDDFVSAVFQVVFAILALAATVLAALAAPIGILVMAIVVLALARAALWLLSKIVWIALNLTQKILELVVAVVDFPAALGVSIINAMARKPVASMDRKLEPVNVEVGEPQLLDRPLVSDAGEPEVAPVEAGPAMAPASEPVQTVTEPVQAAVSEPVSMTASTGSPVAVAEATPPAGTVVQMPQRRGRPITDNLDMDGPAASWPIQP